MYKAGRKYRRKLRKRRVAWLGQSWDWNFEGFINYVQNRFTLG